MAKREKSKDVEKMIKDSRGNIQIKNEQHYFNHNCKRCIECIQYCPM